MALYLDTETTGLRPPHDDLVEVALVDANGRRRIAGVCRPAERWMCRGGPEAQAIHGLAPEHVADARPADAVRADVADLVRGADLVIYNARFDLGFSMGSGRSRQRAPQRRARHRANQGGRLRQALRARARSPEGRPSPWLPGRRPVS